MVSSSSTLLFRILFPKCHVCGRRRRLEANMEQKGRLRRTEKEKKRKWDSSSDLLLFSLLPYGRVAFWMAKWEGGEREEGQIPRFPAELLETFMWEFSKNRNRNIGNKWKMRAAELVFRIWQMSPRDPDACSFFPFPCIEANPLLFLLLLLLPRHRQTSKKGSK